MGVGCSSCTEESTLLAKVVQISSSRPAFPKGQQVVGSALCISGGGARALSFGLGVYRALSGLGLFEKVSAISSVSGGTWLSASFMFAREYRGAAVDTPMLVGAPTIPADLDMGSLNHEPAPLGAGATKDAEAIWLDLVEKRVPSHELWIQLVGVVFLKDFNLDSTSACMAASAADVQRIKAENPCLAKRSFYVPRTDRPKTFVMGGVLLAPEGYYAGADAAVAFQISPDYTGSPYYPHDSKVTYSSEASGDLELIAGGGMVETFAFGGTAPSPQDQSGGRVQVGFPSGGPMTLARAAAISSIAPASTLQYTKGERFVPIGEVWPVTSTILPGPQGARTYNFSDGGDQDNSGLLALLQRGASKVIWIANSYRSLSTTYDFSNATPETFDPVAASVVEQLYDKFGYGYNTDSLYYGNNQVFSQDLLLPLVKKIVALKNAGKPAVVTARYELQANSYWGIQGGSKIEILLVYLEKVADFENMLPPDTQADLARGDEGSFPNYPILKTSITTSACNVNLLAAQGEYSVMQNAEMFREFVKDAP
mmetsp:Transcript_107116/g.301460  ORF Transcript_107116/g.301460 Transcript_107116/m.301460 type:complete len:540 (-) Transcript_107116:104-1723(-)|eukprot:CAMPEP_0117495100 /NCGR_PEP_ID=MMETSP0784-20121206/19957_1 /TAXON_ID=39447 /ORGANISM="" /LENGTH=539 /DNA_ID=CAMNT_0005290009 /DNA_START=110 /DNA_END=1729 /DNA_ORIENTATION=+